MINSIKKNVSFYKFLNYVVSLPCVVVVDQVFIFTVLLMNSFCVYKAMVQDLRAEISLRNVC